MNGEPYSGEKIDIFCHIIPPKYKEALFKKATGKSYYLANTHRVPALTSLEARFRVMDQYEGLRQVLNLGAPPLEHVLAPRDAAEVARIANDEMAELVSRYPDRFVAAVACLPYNDIDAAVRELERALGDLGLRGIQIFSSINGKPMDRPEFLAIYERMVHYDLPILIHPTRDYTTPDYPDEAHSRYDLFRIFAWPFETTLAMSRLVFSGIMERYPAIKFIAHHCGAMLPFFAGRVPKGPTAESQGGDLMKLSRPPLDYFKKFYADTNVDGNVAALNCGHAFFGTDNMVFASDYPYPGGAEKGHLALGEVIHSVETMNLTREELARIFSGNAKRLLNIFSRDL